MFFGGDVYIHTYIQGPISRVWPLIYLGGSEDVRSVRAIQIGKHNKKNLKNKHAWMNE